MPRATLIIAGGVALFFALSILYSLPVLLDPPPPGATPDYVAERVRAHLKGVVPWLFGVSMIAAAAIGARLGRR